jgi:hypothetical protein
LIEQNKYSTFAGIINANKEVETFHEVSTPHEEGLIPWIH